jgi:hypothetical protein
MPSRTGQTLNSSWHTGIVIDTFFIDTVYDTLKTLEESTLFITVLRILVVYLGSGFFHLGSMGQKAPNPGSGFGLDPVSTTLVDTDPDLESGSVYSA